MTCDEFKRFNLSRSSRGERASAMKHFFGCAACQARLAPQILFVVLNGLVCHPSMRDVVALADGDATDQEFVETVEEGSRF